MKAKRVIYQATEFNNLKEIIENAVNTYPSNLAFIIKNKVGKEVKYTNITYTRFLRDINCLGTALIDLGLKDKTIAVIGKNRYEWALGHLATVNGTGIVVPLDKGLPEQEIESCLQRSYSDALIFSSENLEFVKKLQANNTTKVKHFICMDDVEEENIYTMNSLITKGEKLIREGNRKFLDAKIDNEKMSIIIFTSGTTSLAKAVMLSHKNIASNIYAMSQVEEILSTDVNMAFLPFHHTFGSTGLFLFLSKGATNVFCDGLRYIQTNLKEYKVSVFVCVPLLIESMYKKIMKEVEKQGKTKLIKIGTVLSSVLLKLGIDVRRKVFKSVLDQLGGKIRFIVSGASAIDPQVGKNFNMFGIRTVQGYGLTETSPVLAAENETAIRIGSIGFPMPNIDMKIDNPNEQGIGEIIAKGPSVMLGYFENEEATNEVLIKDEEGNTWIHTGDLGYQDKDGYFFITGRKKNVIVLKNGKNVFPEELEILINNLPYVEESMVFGLPKDDDLLVSAKIVYNKDYVKENYPDISKEDLEKMVWEDIKQINKDLTIYKHIKFTIVTDEPMIKTTTAKVKRQEEMKVILKDLNK